jgi:hypothetical protein
MQHSLGKKEQLFEERAKQAVDFIGNLDVPNEKALFSLELAN